jgi:hypothetical protein
VERLGTVAVLGVGLLAIAPRPRADCGHSIGRARPTPTSRQPAAAVPSLRLSAEPGCRRLRPMSVKSIPNAPAQQVGPTEFDLRAESAALRPFTTRSRWVSVGGVTFLLTLGAVAIGANAHDLSTRTFPFYETAGFVVIMVVVVGVIGLTVPTLFHLRSGAVRLKIDGQGFDLEYGNGRIVRQPWDDPKLSFQLFDCREVNPSALRTPGLPFSIIMRGITTVLSNEAYSALINQVALRGLSDSPTRGSQWLYSAEDSPVIHRITTTASKFR